MLQPAVKVRVHLFIGLFKDEKMLYLYNLLALAQAMAYQTVTNLMIFQDNI